LGRWVFFNDSKVVEVDILANNGVVHKIDTVLDPVDGPSSAISLTTLCEVPS
jgi:uncharacterized surface protein with fasciclin (FAS1) repeats